MEREGGTSDQKLESRGKPDRSGSLRWGSGEGWGSPGKGRVQAEWRHGGCLELEAVLLLPGPWPLSLLPSLHLPHFPSPLPPPPPTPRGSWFRFAVESLRGLIPSSVTLHPCGGAPLVYFLSPGCPHRPLPLPHPDCSLSRGNFCLEVPTCSFLNCLPRPQVHTVLASPSLGAHPLMSQNFITLSTCLPTHQMTPRSCIEL